MPKKGHKKNTKRHTTNNRRQVGSGAMGLMAMQAFAPVIAGALGKMLGVGSGLKLAGQGRKKR